MPNSPQQRAVLRCCASCEWIYQGDDCPQCGFASSYGARYVFGDTCYRHARTQKPWLRKKLSALTCKLHAKIKAQETR